MLPILFLLATSALASPFPAPDAAAAPAGFSLPLQHPGNMAQRQLAKRDGSQQDGEWLLNEVAIADTRYNLGKGEYGRKISRLHMRKAKGKRQTGSVQLQNNNIDASYSAQLAFGTPPQQFQVILDTGSADLWVSDASCEECGDTRFDTGASSSYSNLKVPFKITYGQGSANGVLVQDTVTLGGYSIASQTFATVTDTSARLLNNTLSGIMGLGFAKLAHSRAVPWWITLAQSSMFTEKVFTFYLKRWRNQDGASNNPAEGGLATFGYLDSSLYTGEITYIDTAAEPQYWEIPMDKLTVDGKEVALNGANMVAVDTGTTLIGGPEAIVEAFYAQIPGSSRLTGDYANFYQYPCETKVDARLTFGGFEIEINDDDFNMGSFTTDKNMCTGGIYVQSMSTTRIQWIVGATALKNVYSVFRYAPSAVGFAKLSAGSDAAAMAASDPVPASATIDGSASNSTITGTAPVPDGPSAGTVNGVAAPVNASAATSSKSTQAGVTITAAAPNLAESTDTAEPALGQGQAASGASTSGAARTGVASALVATALGAAMAFAF